MTARFSIPTLSLLAVLALAGCMSPEQRMALKVEGMMERQQFDGALRYLDGYLAKHNKSLNGWRYRVLIRLEQGDRGQAAQEYVALNEALSRHEPEVLREVVLGGGGRWLLSDYRALARCGAAGVVDAAFFADLVEPKLLGEGSMSKVAVSGDEIAAVVDALPGRLAPSETWPIVARFVERASPELAVRIAGAAARHLATGGLTLQQVPEALDVLRAAASAADPALREAALLGSLQLPAGDGLEGFAAGIVPGLLAAGDLDRAISSVLLGPGGRAPPGGATPPWTAGPRPPSSRSVSSPSPRGWRTGRWTRPRSRSWTARLGRPAPPGSRRSWRGRWSPAGRTPRPCRRRGRGWTWRPADGGRPCSSAARRPTRGRGRACCSRTRTRSSVRPALWPWDSRARRPRLPSRRRWPGRWRAWTPRRGRRPRPRPW